MKKSIRVLLLVYSLFAEMVYCQLSGTAFLGGQTNHSGIKVKFTAASGTAVTDSCFTAASGNYSINISGGLYSIVFSKAGYQTIMYNNATNIALTNTVVMQTQTLAVGTVSYVSGTVSGNWPGNVIFMVNGDLNVPIGSTLTIQPGAEIKFLGNYSLVVNGVINAVGTAASPIRFLPSVSTATWNQVNLYGGPHRMDHCEFSHFSGINCWNLGLWISNCRITDARLCGIQLVKGASTVENNEIVDARIGIGGGADSSIITCNRISSPLYKNNTASINRGMNITGKDFFADNEVWDCQEGVYLRNMATHPIVENNYIHDNFVGIYIEAINSPSLVLANNTLHKNGYGIYNQHPGLTFCNNVVTSSSIAVVGSSMTCDHNLIFNCSTNFSTNPAVPGLGQVVNTNSNGHPIDSYYNMFIDPLYGTMMPSFKAGSPVMNAGNSIHSVDIGAGVASMCFSSLTLGLREQDHSIIKVFPNPSNGIFTLDLEDATWMRIFNINGEEVFNREINESRIVVNMEEKQAGIYFCEIKGNNGRKVVKLIKF